MAPSPPILQDGVYTITKVNPKLIATLESVLPGTSVVLLAPSVGVGLSQRVGSISHSYSIHEFVFTIFFTRQWEVKRTSKGTYTINNRGNFLSFDGPPAQGKLVRGYPNLPPREWSLYKAAEPQAYQ
jgi:hypothetical protein